MITLSFRSGKIRIPGRKICRPTRFSFLHPEVRQERFRVFEELFSRYETDGVELNLAEDDSAFPYCRFDQVDRLAPLMTQWIVKYVRRPGRRSRRKDGASASM
jgi:hypothetical protein